MTPYFVVGMGSNLGSREAFLRAAELLIDSERGMRVIARSALYLTPPLGPPQPDYLNAALRVETERDPLDALDALLAIEARLGRERRVRWGPRTLDLDLLAWSEGTYAHARLRVPHPRLAERAFALAPLEDVAPTLGPGLGAFARPTARAWTEPDASASFEVRALDHADAWALGATAWWGAPRRAVRVEPLALADPTQLPASGERARVALTSATGVGVAGWRLVGEQPPENTGPAAIGGQPEALRFTPPKLL